MSSQITCPMCGKQFIYNTQLYDGTEAIRCSLCGESLTLLYRDGRYKGACGQVSPNRFATSPLVIKKTEYTLLTREMILKNFADFSLFFHKTYKFMIKLGDKIMALSYGSGYYYLPNRAVNSEDIAFEVRIIEKDVFYNFTRDEYSCLPTRCTVKDVLEQEFIVDYEAPLYNKNNICLKHTISGGGYLRPRYDSLNLKIIKIDPIRT